MSIANILNLTSGNLYDIYCRTLTCGNMAVTSFNVGTATINTIIQGTALLDLSRTLGDGSIFTLVSGDNVIGSGYIGGAMTRQSLGGIRSASGVLNTLSTGGFENSSCMVVQNLLVPPTEQALLCCANDGVNYSILQLLQQGGNTSSITFDNTNGLQISSTIAMSLQAPFIIFPDLVGPFSNNAMMVNTSGTIFKTRLEANPFPVLITNLNRITGSIPFPSYYFIISGLCSCQCYFQITIGAGAGNPSFFVSIPEVPQGGSFATDTVVGIGNVYDVAQTTVISPIITAETPAGLQVMVQIPNALAGIWYVKMEFTYAV